MRKEVRKLPSFANRSQRKFYLVTRVVVIANVLTFLVAILIIMEVLM